MAKSKNINDKFFFGKHSYAEPLPGIPIMELAADKRMVIENHDGVVEYSDTRICVSIRNGVYRISGAHLSLSYMSRFQLIITGRIDMISIERSSAI